MSEYTVYISAVLMTEIECYGGTPIGDEQMVFDTIQAMSDSEKAALVDAALTRTGHDEASLFDIELNTGDE